MTLIIGIFIRDIYNKKEIFFASDGLAVEYEGDKKSARYEHVEKIRKLTSKICIGYTGKNAKLFEDVFNELKNRTPKRAKKELEPFVKRLQEAILKMLKTKKHKEIEKELVGRNQSYHKLIVGGDFNNKLFLIRADSANNYGKSVTEVVPTFPDVALYVAGLTEKIQKETMDILEKRLMRIRSIDEIESIIRYTVSRIAERYPKEINNHVFIRRLSKSFDSHNKEARI